MLGADDATTHAHDRRAGRRARRARLGWRRSRRSCSPTPPDSTAGCGRRSRSDSSPPAAACGRSTSAATATASRPEPSTGDDRTRGRGFAADALAVVDHLGLAGDPDAHRVRPLEGRGRAAARRGATARDLPAHLGVRTDHVPDRAAHALRRRLPARRQRAQAAQRVVVDRRGLRRVRVEAAAQRDDARVAARVRRVRPARSRRRRVRAEVRARSGSRASTGWRRASGVWDVLPSVESTVLVACGETSTDIAPELATAHRRTTPARHARGVARTAGTSARNRIPTGARRRSWISRRAELRRVELTRPAGLDHVGPLLGIRLVRRVERAAIDHTRVALDQLGRDAVGLGDDRERVRARRRR